MKTNFPIKLLGVVFLLIAASIGAEAAFLSPEQSLSRVESNGTIRRMPGNARFTLAHTQKAAGESFLYVFNKGENGFIVTSADDRMPALLGYSDNGTFNLSEASPELIWWLGQYASQAEALLKSDLHQTVKTATTRSEWANVPHLLSTTWSQEYPYNLSCPSDDGGRCVTGCVATAMAQVIKYHNYPVCGNGTASYKWNGQTLSFDYSTANFDYDNMRKNYPASNDRSTKVQKEAVAKLMYACGVGVEMDYGSDESGAIDLYIASALKQYFNFDKSIQYLQRDFSLLKIGKKLYMKNCKPGARSSMEAQGRPEAMNLYAMAMKMVTFISTGAGEATAMGCFSSRRSTRRSLAPGEAAEVSTMSSL